MDGNLEIQELIPEQNQDDLTEPQNFQRDFLGIIWNTEKKYIHLQFGNIIDLCQDLQPTKTNILRIEEMLDHPLGLISSIALPVKFILQRLFELKTHWNNRINVETNEFW